MQQTSQEYVENFHKESVDSLRVLLESEQWRPLPLAANFSIKDIKELRGVQGRAIALRPTVLVYALCCA